jgi:hypothetical protein
VREIVGQIWPQVVGIAALQEFYKYDRFVTFPCGKYMVHIPKNVHTFDIKIIE